MFLDIGIGILLALFTSKVFAIELTTSMTIFGVLFALLPDIDVFVDLFKHGKVGGKEIRFHRQLTHYPLLYLPVVVLMWQLWSAEMAFLFGLAVLAHLLHDSVGAGWGIKWFAPFSMKNFKLLSEKDGTFSSRLLVSWEPDEFRQVVAKYGHSNWMWDIYLRPTPISVIEFLGFVLAIIFYSYLR